MSDEERNRGGPAAAVRDPGLFAEFYRRHIDGVTRFVARRVADPHTVADLTAEVFLAVIDSADSYRPGRGSEAAWLYGIARNVVSTEHRRTSREAALTGRIAGRRLLERDDIARLEDRLDAEAAGRRALAAMRRLPAGERAVLELVAVDQLTVGEAAAALGIRQVTARVRLHRARRALRDVAEPAGAPGAAEQRAGGNGSAAHGSAREGSRGEDAVRDGLAVHGPAGTRGARSAGEARSRPEARTARRAEPSRGPATVGAAPVRFSGTRAITRGEA
ncbi:sigma-70 family RNA polymerase sigma factor [Streptomyces sp. JJ36]|nr:sigma-70 family RNA polymerase sigma factor [Streptomyces sp. JJ36]